MAKPLLVSSSIRWRLFLASTLLKGLKANESRQKNSIFIMKVIFLLLKKNYFTQMFERLIYVKGTMFLLLKQVNLKKIFT